MDIWYGIISVKKSFVSDGTNEAICHMTVTTMGNELRVTLIRYISFLGMTKDSAAVARLSVKDINNIEKGFANPLYADVGSPDSQMV